MKKINFLKNKKVTILCSGPSVRDYHDSNEIVIVPNRSILLPQLKNYKCIIWINGTGWQRNHVYSWWKEIAAEVNCNPSIILARKNNPDWNPFFNRFQKEFTSIFDDCAVSYLIDENNFGVMSTGMRCIKVAIDSGASEIKVAGMEMGINTKYCDTLASNEVISKMGNDSFKRHLKVDCKYLESLSREELQRIVSDPNSGLRKLIKKEKNE